MVRVARGRAYRRLTRLLTELSIARSDGRYPKLLASLAKTHVLVIDDFGLARLTAENRRDLLEIIEDRHALRSTIVTSQFPVEKWHAVVGDGAREFPILGTPTPVIPADRCLQLTEVLIATSLALGEAAINVLLCDAELTRRSASAVALRASRRSHRSP